MVGFEKLVIYIWTAVLGSTSATVLVTRDFDKTSVITLVAAGIYAAENTPRQPWAKQAVAVFAAAVLVLVSAWTDHAITSDEIIAIALAGLGAWQVGITQNNPRPLVS